MISVYSGVISFNVLKALIDEMWHFFVLHKWPWSVVGCNKDFFVTVSGYLLIMFKNKAGHFFPGDTLWKHLREREIFLYDGFISLLCKMICYTSRCRGSSTSQEWYSFSNRSTWDWTHWQLFNLSFPFLFLMGRKSPFVYVWIDIFHDRCGN